MMTIANNKTSPLLNKDKRAGYGFIVPYEFPSAGKTFNTVFDIP